ncbi:MAG: hypothetical protein GY874_09320 [Desulfobacteraceae bacterium]|nr:hypothetical protein [Desulfobacteraceae bacterium]
MAIESPLFQSSMELLGHSISHFNSAEELDRKLVILHLANSIELILKDMVLDSETSIYKNPKETITIHSCIEILQKNEVPIPFLNKIELLIDERNALQHRFGSPNKLTSIFYMDIVHNFFKEVLKTHYNQDFNEVLAQFVEEKELTAYRMREPNDDTELENLKKLSKVHSLGALLSAMTYFEGISREFGKKFGIENKLRTRPVWYMTSPRYFEKFGIDLPEKLGERLDEARRLRNLVAHGRREPSKADVANTIDSIEEFERFLSNIDIEKTKILVDEYYEAKELEREDRQLEYEEKNN